MKGNNGAIGGGGFHHVGIHVKNFDKTLSFYTEGLGFVLASEWSMNDKKVAFLDTGDGNYLQIFEGSEDSLKMEGVHLAFRTDDCEKAIAAASKTGTRTKGPKEIIMESDPPITAKIGFCKGPDGETIEFFQSI